MMGNEASGMRNESLKDGSILEPNESASLGNDDGHHMLEDEYLRE